MRTASVSETRQQLSSFLNWIKGNRKDVVIENRGQAEAVIIPFADYDLLQEARERRRRQQAVAALKQIALEVSGRNEAMSEAEMEACNCEALTKVVVRSLPFQRTTAPLTKLEPLTTSVNASPPTVAELGLRLETAGTGLMTS